MEVTKIYRSIVQIDLPAEQKPLHNKFKHVLSTETSEVQLLQELIRR